MQLVKDNTPKIDPRLGNSLAYDASKNVPDFIDRIFRLNAASFPRGLEYLGYEKATPMEGYRYMTRVVTNNVRRYDINRNDIRLYNFLFRFQDKIIRKPIYLPFIRRFGFMYMNGVKYVVSPVVSDGIITVKPTSIFIKLIKTKLWFEKINSLVVIDGIITHASIYYSQIHNKPADAEKVERAIKMVPSLVHYMLCKHGMDRTLQILGFNKRVLMLDRDEFIQNQSQYPKEDWVVIESTGKKPSHTYLRKYYDPLPFVFLVDRKEFETNDTAKNIFGALIYILDHFTSPKRMNPDIVNDTDAWRSMLGESIFSSDEHYAIIKEKMDKHIAYVDEYVDDMVCADFVRIGFPQITDIYLLFKFIIDNFATMTSGLNKTSESNTIYGKQLQVLNYLLFNITKAVNNSYFGLKSLRLEQERNPNKQLREEDIDKCLKMIRTEEILKIKSHAEIIPVDDPTDLPLLKIGRMVVPQELSDRLRTSKTTFDVGDDKNILHESLIECGAALDMSKADPSGHNRVNMFVRLSEDNTIIPNPELTPVMTKLRNLLYVGQE